MAEQVTAPETTAPAVSPDVKAVPVEPEIPKGEKVYVIKHPDGREEKWWGDKVQERLQKSVGLEKRVSDADKYEKAFNNFVAKVQDPGQLLELLNHPDLKYDDTKQEALMTAMLGSKKPHIVEAVKRWLYENEVKPSLMDPKDRELMEAKSEAEQLRQEKLARQKELKEAEETKNVAAIKEAYRSKLAESYQKSGLPVDDYLVRQVMEKARLFVRSGQHPDFEKCCQMVQQDFITQIKGVLGKATVDNILNYLDGETPKTINKALMKALDKKEESPVPADKSPVKKREKKERSAEETRKWLKNLERGIID